ncbi:RNA ligase-domain-containing protein [Peziza echinospora]|nr:RNA ligase-domain-containing protein [Peziza echinospora]
MRRAGAGALWSRPQTTKALAGSRHHSYINNNNHFEYRLQLQQQQQSRHYSFFSQHRCSSAPPLRLRRSHAREHPHSHSHHTLQQQQYRSNLRQLNILVQQHLPLGLFTTHSTPASVVRFSYTAINNTQGGWFTRVAKAMDPHVQVSTVEDLNAEVEELKVEEPVVEKQPVEATKVELPKAKKVLSGSLTQPKYQSPAEINNLVAQLEQGLKKGSGRKSGYSCKKTVFDLEGKDIAVSSWKFNDWDYKKFDLPTYARGLFTYRDPVSGNYEIVTRGYDKFFNVDEVTNTKWSHIESHTKGPYELTVKENGCIIFLSGLPDGSLLVCSKHSTGTRGNPEASHAATGEKWIERHLQSVGKTKEELAKWLRDMNATAVAELCDDSFEEHILAYEPEQAGLYVHGLNFNVPTFATCSQAEVQSFAETFGMRKTDYFTMNDVASLKKFLEEAAETGSWDGKDVEGFVIRCEARQGQNTWNDWFFKYKFEEPYLMYRQWREVTKAMINRREPKYKKHVKVTKAYVEFARKYFHANPEAAKQYQLNHGIIALRDAFLKSLGAKGSELIHEGEEEEGTTAPRAQSERPDEASAQVPAKDLKVLLVPIATIGCGKTTLAVALTKLFKWGHIQNDDIMGSSRPPRFAGLICKAFEKESVIVADRNNHQFREREQLFKDITPRVPSVQMVALHYVHYRDDVDSGEMRNRIEKATHDRVFARGDRHQTIQAATKNQENIKFIMRGFVKRFEPLDVSNSPDWSFRSVIDLDIEADTRVNLETVVRALRKDYPSLIKTLPTAEEMDRAVEYALNHYEPKQPNNKQKAKGQNQSASTPAAKKAKAVEYFSVSVPTDKLLEAIKKAMDYSKADASTFYDQLKNAKRVQDAFHVTLIHRASIRTKGAHSRAQSLWDRYINLIGTTPEESVKVGIKLGRLVWDGRLMAATVEVLPVEGSELDFPCFNETPHITIGTKDKSVKPVESNDMLTRWKADGKSAQSLNLGGAAIEGTFHAVSLNR